MLLKVRLSIIWFTSTFAFVFFSWFRKCYGVLHKVELLGWYVSILLDESKWSYDVNRDYLLTSTLQDHTSL